jgi:hypothetical protein
MTAFGTNSPSIIGKEISLHAAGWIVAARLAASEAISYSDTALDKRFKAEAERVRALLVASGIYWLHRDWNQP